MRLLLIVLIIVGLKKCDGTPIDIRDERFTPNYRYPFRLRINFKTDPSFEELGGIYSNLNEDGSLIEVVWIQDGANRFLQFHLRTSLQNKMIVSNSSKVEKDKNYEIQLSFDGKHCKWFLDDSQVGSPVDCKDGFRNLNSPKLCFTAFGGWGGWKGLVSGITIEKFILLSEESGEGKYFSLWILSFSFDLRLSH